MNIWSRKIKLWLKSSSEISGGFPGSIRPNPAWGSLRCLSRRRICRSSRISGRPLRTPDVYLTTMVYSFFQHKIMYHVLFCIYVWYDMCTDLTNLYCNSTTQSVQYLSAPYHMCIIYVRWLSGADMYLTQDCFSHMRRHTPSGSLPPSPCSPVPQIHWYADYY